MKVKRGHEKKGLLGGSSQVALGVMGDGVVSLVKEVRVGTSNKVTFKLRPEILKNFLFYIGV